MSVLDKFLDAIRLNDDYEEEDADSDSFFDEEDDDIENILNYYSCILTRDEQKLIHNLTKLSLIFCY